MLYIFINYTVCLYKILANSLRTVNAQERAKKLPSAKNANDVYVYVYSIVVDIWINLNLILIAYSYNLKILKPFKVYKLLGLLKKERRKGLLLVISILNVIATEILYSKIYYNMAWYTILHQIILRNSNVCVPK